MAGVYFIQMPVFIFGWNVTAILIIGVYVIAGCPQGESLLYCLFSIALRLH